MKVLEKAFVGDRMKARVLGWTPAGLVEINRKKSRRSAAAVLYDACPICSGTGKITSAGKLVQQIKQQVAARGSEKAGQSLLLEVPARLAPLLDKRTLADWEGRYSVHLRLQTNSTLHPESFSLLWDRH